MSWLSTFRVTGPASSSRNHMTTAARALILLPTVNEQPFTFSMMEIATAPLAIRCAAAASVSDLAAGRTVSTLATSTSSIVIGDPAREMAELHTLGKRGRQSPLRDFAISAEVATRFQY
jgi:hypothetical protein